MAELVGENCNECGARAAWTEITYPVSALSPPPQQVQRYVRFTDWQCLAVEAHRGRYATPTEDAA